MAACQHKWRLLHYGCAMTRGVQVEWRCQQRGQSQSDPCFAHADGARWGCWIVTDPTGAEASYGS